MPLTVQAQIENNFTRGLITEATGLNFPENACTETYDCVFHENGRVERRLGIDYETDFEIDPVTRSTKQFVVQEYIWDDVAGLGDISFVVIQIGNILHFWQVNEIGSLSSNKKAFTVDLNGYTIVGSPNAGTQSAQFAVGNGVLIIVHPYCKPIYITYSRNTDTIAVTSFNILIRDLTGLDDGETVDVRPNVLSAKHAYNLRNQGWYTDVPTQGFAGTRNVLDHWVTHRNDSPSNADVWWLLKNSSSLYDLTQLNVIGRGAAEAPKGHYILAPYSPDRILASGIQNLPINSTPAFLGAGYHRPSTVAFHNGRTFFAGINAPGFANHIYFSQILDENNRFGFCYQQADPTAERTVGLVASDGGEIIIPEAGTITKLIATQGYLLVFCSNGLWAISGNQQYGFTAIDFTIFQVSGIRSLSASSFVIPKDGLPIWWNADGIFTIKYNQQVYNVQQAIEVQSLTDSTIKTYFNTISSTSKRYAKGSYNPLGNIVQWVFHSIDPNNVLEYYEYDRVLLLNLNSGAFYTWTISEITNGPKVNGILASRGRGVLDTIENVTDQNDVAVVDSSGDNVISEIFLDVPLSSAFRYTTTVLTSGSTYQITFSEEIDSTYTDWVSFNTTGADYTSYLITGYKTHGQAQRKFQADSVFTYFEYQAGGSCFLQGIWDFANDDSSGKMTSYYQVFKNRPFRFIEFSRVRLRGRGYALQLKFLSESTKPFKLIGWSTYETQPQVA